MRLALAMVALACAGSAAAEPVQDRYGPPRKVAAAAPRPYEGRLLGWAGKAAPQPPAPAPAEPSAPPEPQGRDEEPRATAPIARPAPPAPPAVALRPAMSHWAADPLPQSLYDTSAAPPARAAAPPVTPVVAPTPPPPQPRPVTHAAAAAPPPVARIAAAPPPPAPQRGAAPSRLYSLHREYGMAPDTMPAAPTRTNYVLIGPPDAPEQVEGEETPARKPPTVDARLF